MVMQHLKRLWVTEDGASLVEYGLLLAFIAAVTIGAVQALGLQIAPPLVDFVAAAFP